MVLSKCPYEAMLFGLFTVGKTYVTYTKDERVALLSNCPPGKIIRIFVLALCLAYGYRRAHISTQVYVGK
jgi:hypothetical protein